MVFTRENHVSTITNSDIVIGHKLALTHYQDSEMVTGYQRQVLVPIMRATEERHVPTDGDSKMVKGFQWQTIVYSDGELTRK